ncbi:hypothetical protein ACUNWD_04495 [Sunxiuqinia sp. A32]|uniref:hypothetical protein n=1 Tax=Sunxiuqinia sp. A32 TaxID=3461496 RepID=UPI004045B113
MKKIIYVVLLSVVCLSLRAQTLNIPSSQFKPGEIIYVDFTAPGSYADNAWVGIIPSSVQHGSEATNDKYDLTYQYLKKRTSGRLEFKAPAKEGSFDLRMNDSDSGGKEVASVSFVVSNTSQTANSGSSSNNQNYSANHQIAGDYTTDFKDMTINISGSHVTGTYAHLGGKIDGNLQGNKLVGAWTQTNGKGKFEFVFTSDFSSFKGKWGYNNDAPTKKWDGEKKGSSVGSASLPSVSNLPIDIAGSWSSNGSRNQIARVHIWQNGDEFQVISAWPDETTGKWKSYRGEGRFEGRNMNFKVFPSTTDGSSADQGYVQHWTVSSDNSEISGYYTRHGKRTIDKNVLYKLVK